MLKTASVRVSCIQNTQIRGETIAKVFGKVDTFWTYQCAAEGRGPTHGGWPVLVFGLGREAVGQNRTSAVARVINDGVYRCCSLLACIDEAILSFPPEMIQAKPEI
jgi:hypothetical protein